MKPTIVLADAEKRNVRVLGVALRNEGYTVRVAANGVEALEKIEATSPAVVVSDSRLPKIDGYSLARTLKERSETAHIPVVLLTNRSESPNQGREGDVAEFLPKPVFVREFVACVGLLVARGARARMAAEAGGSGRFSGSTKDIPVVDLLQTFEVLRESGVLQLARGSQEGEIFFREGRAVDAKLGRLRGERAVYALFVWSDAMFDIEFKPVSREDVLDRSIGTIVMEGMRRVDEWGAICEQLRPLTTILDVNDGRFIEQVVARLYDSTEPSWSAGETRLLSSAAHSVIADALQSSRTPRLQVDADVEDATDEPHDDAVPEAPLQRTPAMARTSHGGGLASSPPKSIAAPDDPSRIPQAGSEVDVATTPDADAVAPAPQKRLGASEVARNLAPAVATTPHVNGLASAHPKTLPAPEETAVATTPHVNGLASARPKTLPAPEEAAVATTPAAVTQMPPRAIPASEDRAAGAPHAGTPGKASALTDERDNDEAVPLRAHRHGEVDDADVPAAVGDANSPFPSAPPWAREIEDSSSPPPFDEEISIPGVPHVVSRAVKVAFTASIAVAGLIGITGGMRALSVRAERRAEEATRRAAMTAVAAPAEVGASSMPVLPPPPVIEIPSTQTVVPPIAEPGTSAAEAAGPARTVMPPKGEWPVDIVRPSGRSTLVTAAEQALLHGATDRALVLANQAVTTEPQNADAWLTLAAAHRVLGDRAAEREDYRKCIDQAITESVNHCRVLAAR